MHTLDHPLQLFIAYLPYLPLALLANYLLQNLIAYTRNRLNSDLQTIPSPPLPLWKRYTIGHNLLYHVLRADAFETAALFNAWRKTYGHIFQIRSLFGERCVCITSETAIRQVNITKHASFIKATSTRNVIASIVGDNGLLLAEGPVHTRLRRAVAPAMHYDALSAIGTSFLEQGKLLACRLATMRDTGPDVLHEVRTATFALIFETCLGKNAAPAHLVSQLQQAYSVVFPEPPSYTLRNAILHSLFWFVHRNHFSYRQDLKTFIRSTIQHICEKQTQQRKNGAAVSDTPLVSLMVDEDTKKNIDSQQMVETVLSFLLAGQATTSISVCWTLYILAREPQWQERLLEELKGWREEDGLDALHRLPLLDRIVKESIRLYPPVFFTTRKTAQHVEVDGFKLPAGTVVRVPVLAVHRNEDIWGSDASDFNPDRFLRAEIVAGTKMHWCAFAFGPRGCIGQRFALVEIKAFVAQVIIGQKVSIKPLEDPAPSCVGPFATPNGLKLYFAPRDAVPTS